MLPFNPAYGHGCNTVDPLEVQKKTAGTLSKAANVVE